MLFKSISHIVCKFKKDLMKYKKKLQNLTTAPLMDKDLE